MSTVKCRDCGGSVSRTAATCPQCGRELRRSAFARVAIGCLLAIIMLVLLAVVFLPYIAVLLSPD